MLLVPKKSESVCIMAPVMLLAPDGIGIGRCVGEGTASGITGRIGFAIHFSFLDGRHRMPNLVKLLRYPIRVTERIRASEIREVKEPGAIT